jgi:hypothetical protein
VPASGILTAGLVAPGAISPVSTERSFSRTRWTTLSLLRKTTIRPAADAGFGENDWAPRSPTIVIVTVPDDDEDGDDGVPDPPPPHPHAPARATTRAAVRFRGRMSVLLQPLNEQAGYHCRQPVLRISGRGGFPVS